MTICDRIEDGRRSVFFLVQKQNDMGFFSKISKKISTKNTSDVNQIDAKIHIMQYDLDEIAKNGHVEIEPVREENSKQRKLTSGISSKNGSTPLDSPFSQSSYPLSDDMVAPPLETSRVSAETIQQEPPAKETSTAKTVENQPTPSTYPSAPLNLPLFQETPDSRKPMHLNIGGQASIDAPPKTPVSQDLPTKTPKSPSDQQESLRTGKWSIESQTKTTASKESEVEKMATDIHLQKTPTDKNTIPDNVILKERWSWKYFSLIIITIGVIGSGAFYFWKTRLSTREGGVSTVYPSIPNISENNNNGIDNTHTEPDVMLPFSTTHPNPFLIDVETETVSTLREQLIKNAETMKQANMAGPVPFSVVDKTNTPIAFFIFASIFNLGLSGDLLNSLDNDFTLFLFLDNGEPRTILTVTAKNPADAQRYLLASEKMLPLSLKNIVLADTPPTVPVAAFTTTLYRDVAIRYFNLPTETPLSFDYAFIGNTLIVGTSKNAERAGIDTILDSKK